MTKVHKTYKEFRSNFNQSDLDRTDYLHFIFGECGLPIDFVVCLLRLAIPDFKIIDGFLFIMDKFDEARYEDHVSRCDEKSEVQYWLNLTYVNGIFEEIEEDTAIMIAGLLERSWNSVIEKYHSDVVGRARVLHDEKLGEVFVTIDQG